MMRYNNLPHSVFSDTMRSSVVPKRGNKYGQDYCTQYRWQRCHPMKLKSEAHGYFSIIFKRDSVPPKIVVDNSKDKSLGKFASKLREADFHLVNTYPFTPCMMHAEGCIKNLKQGSYQKMLKSASPRRLW